MIELPDPLSANRSLLAKGPRTLYWYMTNNCNLACNHCWVVAGANNTPPNVGLDRLLPFFQEAIDLGLQAVKLTGGEPTLHKDFRATCNLFASQGVAVWIETNGLLIDEQMMDFLAELDVQVGISVDHAEAGPHDEFRGREGAHATSTHALRGLLQRGVVTAVTSSLSEENLESLPALADFLLNDVGVVHVALNPIVPFGRAVDPAQESDDWTHYLERIFDAYYPLAEIYGLDRLVLNLPPALTTSAVHQRCLLGDDILSVLASGNVSICSFGVDEGDTISFGNATTDSVQQIWAESPGLKRLRTSGQERLKGICSNCVFVNTCRGYCRAVALSVYGDVDAPFPVCQYMADQGRFPEVYMIDPGASPAYTPNLVDQVETLRILPGENKPSDRKTKMIPVRSG